MALKYISSTISETDGHVFYDNHDLDRVIWVDPQEGSHVVWERQQPSEWKGLRILPTGDNMVSVRLVVTGTPGTINPIYYSGDQGVTWLELTTTDSDEYSEIWLKANNPTGLGAVVTEPSQSIYILNSYNSIFCTGESYATGNITSLLDDTGNMVDLSGCDDWCFAGVFNSSNSDLIGYDCFYPTVLSKGCYMDCLPSNTVYCSSLPATNLAEACYYEMFQYCRELEYAPYLNATTLYKACYSSMFYGCTSLVESPILPATNLANSCYFQMFHGCTSLISTPELPATTLAEQCYALMFYGCTSLTTIVGLPATNLSESCYVWMFNGCTSLVSVPTLPATILQQGCYFGMFYGCTSLVNPPIINSQVLAKQCYYSMFEGCTSLVNAPALPATTLAEECYKSMFYGCTSLVNPPSLPATTLSIGCYRYMFSFCSSLQVAPILPAEVLTSNCYKKMFEYCSSLNRIVCLATNRNAVDCTDEWCQNVPEVGDFYCPSEVTPQWVKWNASNIPPYWTRHSTDKVIIYGYSEHGTVTGSGTYNIGDSVTLTFTPSQGYVFDHWEYVDGTTASTDNPYTFVASESLVLKAVTEYARYTIDAGALNGVVAATVGGSPVQLPYTGAYGTVVELTVQPTQGHEFWFWTDGSTYNPRQVTLTEDMELYAVCVATDMEYLYFLCDGHFTCGITGGGVSGHPNLEYSVYNIETQSWGDWTEPTWTWVPAKDIWSTGIGDAFNPINYIRLRGSNPTVSQGFNFQFNREDVRAAGTPNALLFNGAVVRTLTIERCFSNMFRVHGSEYFVSRSYMPCEFPSNFLPATTLSPRCYYGMFSKEEDQVGTTVWRGPRVYLPATNLAEGCYGNLTELTSLDYRSYSFQNEIYYYGPSLTETQMEYYCKDWFKGCKSGYLHVKQDVTVPEIGHGITILHDLA